MTPRTTLITAALLLPLLTGAGSTDPLDAFPEAEGGARYVIVLPALERAEAGYAVELVAGRVMATDGVNQVSMDTALVPQTLEGWGYTYYEMTGSGRTASTLMAVPEGTPEVQRFVGGAPLQVRYNSRLPIVVYVPDGFELRYRIWAAADAFIPATPG